MSARMGRASRAVPFAAGRHALRYSEGPGRNRKFAHALRSTSGRAARPLNCALGHRKLPTMSEKASPKKSGSIPMGAVGLVLTILFCVEIAVSSVKLSSVLLGGALGFAGLIISLVGIAKGSGRVAGVFGIFAFLLGCLMVFSTVLDMIAHERGHGG